MLLRRALVASAFAAAAACSLQPACAQCGGSYDALHCKCACPFSKLEALALGYAGLVLIGVLLLA